MLYLLGCLKGVWGSGREAHSIMRNAYILAQRLYGEQSIEAAQCLSTKGDMHYRLGTYKKAIDRYEDSLSIYKNYYSISDSLIIKALFRIGLAWGNLGEFKIASSFYEKALEGKNDSINQDEYPEKELIVRRLSSMYDLNSLVDFSSRL